MSLIDEGVIQDVVHGPVGIGTEHGPAGIVIVSVVVGKNHALIRWASNESESAQAHFSPDLQDFVGGAIDRRRRPFKCIL